MEIERKYLLDQKPDLAGLKHVVMQQHYLSVDPVLRIRKAGEKHIFTYKSGMGMVRQEEEFEISAEDFEKLVQKRIGNGVYKVRYYLPLDEAHTAEIDIYEQQMEGLMVVEVEFENEAEAERFQKPEWFGREVTDDPAYTNAMLAFGSWKKE